MYRFNSIVKLIGFGALALGLTACERNADPTRDYPELANDVPAVQRAANEQTFDGVLFDLRIQDHEDSNVLDFYEGKEGSYVLLARSFLPGANFTLRATEMPKGASLIPSSTRDTWVIKWTPAKELIPKGLSSQEFKIQVEFALDQNSSARARELFNADRRNRIKRLTLKVNFPESQPQVRIIGLDKNEYKRGDVVPFTVEVTDINSSKTRRPDVIVTYDKANVTNEAKSFPATMAVIIDPRRPDQFVGANKWVFHYYFDTTTIPAAYFEPKAGFEAGEFIIYAVNSSSKLDSTRILKRIKIAGQGAN